MMDNTALLDLTMDWVRKTSIAVGDVELFPPAMQEDARLLHEAFSGEDGRKRLMVLARMTVLRSPVDSRFPSAEGQAYAHERNGQNSLFAAIVKYLDLHEETLRKPHHDREQQSGLHDTRAGGFDPDGLIAAR